MDLLRAYGPWALVTGASSGIGEEFARQLAAAGLHLVIVARRRERLDALAAALSAKHGVEVRAGTIDLGRADFIPELERVTHGLDLGLVVSNAGFGDKGNFLDADLGELLRMLDVNCRSTLLVAHTFGKRLVARGKGGLIVTSSLAAFQSLPFTAHYAATKGYGLQLAEALAHELRPRGVDVLALCPGSTDTEGPRRTGVNPDKVPGPMMHVTQVVRAALSALGRRDVVIPGAMNALTYAAVRAVPRRWASSIGGRLIKRATGMA